MLKGKKPSNKFIGRIGLFLVIGAFGLTIAAVSTNAAGLSFMDSVKEFFGFEMAVEPNSTPATEPMFFGPTVSTLLTDDFNYTNGTLLTANGWTAHSGAGTNPVTVTSGGLSYPGSGIGNAVALTTVYRH